MGQRLRFARLAALIAPLALTSPALAQTTPPTAPPEPTPPPAGESEEGEGEEVPVEDAPPAKGETAEGEPTDDEMLEELEGENPSRPPPRGKGVIWGVVKETEFHETLVEAPVQVIGKKIQTVTDVEGRFRLELPPGTYNLRISYELHKSTRVDGVVVDAGKVIKLDFDLSPDKSAIDVLEVVEEADKNTLEGLILARQKATVVGDSIGRSEIAKTPDRNAAQAAQRVVGATVVGGRFVYVRGLGERYTNALLNGVPLPSPEPDRAAVPLDLFPTGVLNSLTIAKTFTPDSPADFAGGSVRIETREIPKEPLLQLSGRLGYNTNSTFRDRLDHRGSSTDWLGLDDGTRALPAGFPERPIAELTPDQRTAAGRSLNTYMSALHEGTPPDHSFSVVGGRGWDLGNDRKLGAVGSVSWGRSYMVRRDEVVRIFTPPQPGEGAFHLARDYRATTGNVNVNWGAFGSLTYRFDARNELSLTGLRTTLADDRTQYISGFHDVRQANIHTTRQSFVTRALNLGMLRGEHRFPDLDRAQLDWNVVLSSATRDEPDRRDAVWQDRTDNPEIQYDYTDALSSGRHFFAEQSELQYGGGVDWTQPVGPHDSKLKFGGLVSLRDRAFDSRALTLRYRGVTPDARDRAHPATHPVLRCQQTNLDVCNDALFVPENIGHLPENALDLDEFRDDGDQYDAILNVYAVYVMADLGITDDVRVLLGERIEHTRQIIDAYNAAREKDPDLRARISQTDILPAVSGVWSVNKKSKLRTSLTRTLARPQLRELSPFSYQDYFGARLTGGFKDLKLTNITNLDFRIEHFPTLREVLAFSVFFKDFENPIEAIILGGGDEGGISFRNAEGAQLIGLEFETRKGLEFAAEALKDFSLTTNLTLAYSRIQIKKEESLALTNLSRALVNQAPWVFNFGLNYTRESIGTSATVLLNVVGPRIFLAGSQGLDDVYEHPRGVLDLTVQQEIIEHLALKLEAKNILNSEVMLTQGCGGKGVFGSSWYFTCSRGESAAVTRYTEGASFGLSGTYDF